MEDDGYEDEASRSKLMKGGLPASIEEDHNQQHQFGEPDINREPDTAGNSCKCSPPNKWGPLFLIYILSFLGRWGDRKWMFTAGIILIQITPKSLRLIALYYSTVSVFVILFSPPLGSWIDKSGRLKAALTCLITQNLLVALSGLCFLFVLQYPYLTEGRDAWIGWCLVTVAVVSAASAAVSSSGTQTCLTKDWLVEVCAGDLQTLAKANAINRAIDLGTEVLCPSFVGYLMTVFSVSLGAVIIVAWNLLSLFAEAFLYVRIYNISPRVSKPKERITDGENEEKVKDSNFGGVRKGLLSVYQSWHSYMTHTIRSAGLALAMLYMTVLSIDNYSIAYMYESGINPGLLGIFTSLSSIPGLIGSIIFPKLRVKIGVEKTGLLGFLWLTCSLTLCVASVFSPGSLFYLMQSTDVSNNSSTNANLTNDGEDFNFSSMSTTKTDNLEDNIPYSYTSVALLLTGIIISRFGLWTADLSVTQSLQELVETDKRGAINGVQFGLNMFFDLLRSVLLILMPAIDTFGYMIIISFVFITMGSCSYISFYSQRRKSNVKTEDCENPEEIKALKVPTEDGKHSNNGEEKSSTIMNTDAL